MLNIIFSVVLSKYSIDELLALRSPFEQTTILVKPKWTLTFSQNL